MLCMAKKIIIKKSTSSFSIGGYTYITIKICCTVSTSSKNDMEWCNIVKGKIGGRCKRSFCIVTGEPLRRYTPPASELTVLLTQHFLFSLSHFSPNIYNTVARALYYSPSAAAQRIREHPFELNSSK